MTRIDMSHSLLTTEHSSVKSDFELTAEKIEKNNQYLSEFSNVNEDNPPSDEVVSELILSEQDTINVIISGAIMNEVIQRMKLDQQRLKEIFNEI
ncbi:hypothetical protein BS333_08450 [Vibrio azureus]|uniref:Uncharacterized protein n=1 Tax=Vibrio azureus NBRC 104587 TaxID=1219077 RepID=U3AQ27_9VIBR|nr:hypothetical protein [Vibrio azureus]AUI86414.1 hypothetical protein BS333_08450 [Vibrio azureus]GAD75392.1 hypothetical protein VAZ01S_024_00750 [Vibrio azureus NBRC 104587]